MIDKMIADLRQEQKDDNKAYENCDKDETKLKNEIEDLEYKIKKTDELLERLDAKRSELEDNIDAKQEEIDGTNATMTELRDTRIQEREDYDKAMKDDTDAVNLLGQAIDSISQFYTNNKIPLALTQEEPKADEDQPPGTWGSGGYQGRKGESGGIIAILTMIKEDLETE